MEAGKSQKPFIIHAGNLDLETIEFLYHNNIEICLSVRDKDKIRECYDFLNARVASGQTIYGVNTGFGVLANKKINIQDIAKLQRNLVLSHATGAGENLSIKTVRLVILLKINALAQGFSGVSPELVERLVELYNSNFIPCVPEQGSVGASGDLCPLAHLSATLLGYGEFYDPEGHIIKASDGLLRLGWEPFVLQAKEGLSLINGTQVSTALAIVGLIETKKAWLHAIIAGCLSVDAIKGSIVPLDAKIHEAKKHRGQIKAAKLALSLIRNSEINLSHINCEKVQDPYSIRCQPQVMGASLMLIENCEKSLVDECNGVSDNPLIFVKEKQVLSGGNFHAQAVAFLADQLALALCEIGSISERRIALMTDEKNSKLPAFLVENSGLNSGFMIAHVTSSALVSENKQLAHPVSVDSIPTSANQEDHVSMATYGARRLGQMARNVNVILGIEILAACNAIEFHRPLRSSSALEQVFSKVREIVPRYEADRYFYSDIQAIKLILESGILLGGEVSGVKDLLKNL